VCACVNACDCCTMSCVVYVGGFQARASTGVSIWTRGSSWRTRASMRATRAGTTSHAGLLEWCVGLCVSVCACACVSLLCTRSLSRPPLFCSYYMYMYVLAPHLIPYTHTHIYTHTFTHTCTHTLTLIHTHTHTHTALPGGWAASVTHGVPE
jgi:hypothetical protein